jgi:hypothetical protein
MRLPLSFILTVLLFIPGIAFAANLSVFPASITLKKGDEVGFIVHLQAQDSINTVGASLVLPPNLAFLSASDGTAVTDWIQHPTFDSSNNAVSFAGIMPGGWQGDGTLAVINVAAKEAGTYSLSYDQSQTEVYKNDGQATPEPVVYGVAAVNLLASPALPIGAVVLLVLLLVLWWALRRYKIRLV